MTTAPRSHVLRVRGRDGAVAGTAFLARGEDGRAYVLTCAHVVNAALGRRAIDQEPPPGGAEVAVERAGGAPGHARLLHWAAPVPVGPARASALADIAVLASPFAPEPVWPPLRVEPPELVVPEGASRPFHGFGYMGPEDGTAVRGSLRAVDHAGWFVARQPDGSGWFVEAGLSGAPVLGGDNRVLGMVVQRLGQGSGEGVVIPAMALARAWPPLASPYVGLRPFQAGTAHLFFGRAGAVRAVRERLERQPVVCVVGASGSGKSSLLRAGLVPLLARERWAAVVFEPKQFPLAQLAEAVARTAEPDLRGADLLAAADAWRRRLAEGRLDPALDAVRERGADGVLVAVDQLEQFATADEDRAALVAGERGPILRALRDAVAARDDVRVALTLRADLVGRVLDADEEAGRLLRDPYPPFVLPRMDGDELRQAVRDGAALFGVEVDRGLAARLADDAGRDEGRLPLLQSALRGLWRGIERRPDGGWRLPPPVEGLDLEATLARRADEALAALRAGRGGPPVPEEALRRALTSLVRPGGTDGGATKRVLVGPDPDAAPDSGVAAEWAVLRRLAGERLVVLGAAGRRPTAELAHEALIGRWPTLADWVAADRDFLRWRDRLREFELPRWIEGGRGEESLPAGRDLAVAEDWLRERRADLAPDEVAFIEAAAEQRRRREGEAQARLEQERALRLEAVRARRRAVRALWATGAVATAFLVAVYAVRDTERSAAARDRRVFVGQQQRQMAQQAENMARTDPLRGYLIAVQAAHWRGVPEMEGRPPLPPEVHRALLSTRRALLARTVEGIPSGLAVYGVSRDATRIVTLGDRARLWALDLAAARATEMPLQDADGVDYASFSDDGERLFLLRARVGQIRTGTIAQLGPWRALRGGVFTVPAFDGALRKVAWVDGERSVRLTDLTTGRDQILSAAAEFDRPVHVSANGEWVVAARGRGDEPPRPAVWHVATGAARSTIGDAGERYLDSATATDGTARLLTAPREGGLRLWSLGRAEPRWADLPTEPAAHGTFAKFAPGGHLALVITRSPNAAQAVVRSIDKPDERPIDVNLRGLSAEPAMASLDASGTRVVVADRERRAYASDTRVSPLPGPVELLTPGGAQAVLITPDGRHGLTLGAVDRRVRLWDLDVMLASDVVLGSDQSRLAEAAEREVRARIEAGTGACLKWEDWVRLGYGSLPPRGSVRPRLPDTPDRHACPLAAEFTPR